MTKVYTCNQSADDLLLIGFVNIGFNDGTKVDGSFVVRAIVDEADSQSPRLKLYQGWMVSLPLSPTPRIVNWSDRRWTSRIPSSWQRRRNNSSKRDHGIFAEVRKALEMIWTYGSAFWLRI